MPRHGTQINLWLKDDVAALAELLANARNENRTDLVSGLIVAESRAFIDAAKMAGVLTDADEYEEGRAYFRTVREAQASVVEAVLAGGAKPHRPRAGLQGNSDYIPAVLRRCVLRVLKVRPDFGLPMDG